MESNESRARFHTSMMLLMGENSVQETNKYEKKMRHNPKTHTGQCGMLFGGILNSVLNHIAAWFMTKKWSQGD